MMARLTACFVLSAVLVLATGICSGNGQNRPLEQAFARLCPVVPGLLGTINLPIKVDPFIPVRSNLVRIISGGNTNLSITADDKGNIVLAKTNCSDIRQLWQQNFTIDGFDPNIAAPVSTFERFMLVSAHSIIREYPSIKAMQIQPISADGTYPVKLAPYLSEPASSMLWWHKYQVFGDREDNIESDKNRSLVLDGGNLREGSVVVADDPADSFADRVQWRFERLLE